MSKKAILLTLSGMYRVYNAGIISCDQDRKGEQLILLLAGSFRPMPILDRYILKEKD